MIGRDVSFDVAGPAASCPFPGRVASSSVLVAKTDGGLRVVVEKRGNHPFRPRSTTPWSCAIY